jgi:poly(hydroxyalkanoate) granule-associated protein
MATRTKRKAAPRKVHARATPARKLEALRKDALGTVDKIVKQGNALQAKGRKYAFARAKEARGFMDEARETVAAKAEEARSRTMDAVSHLEKVFENRVQGAISKLGVPTARDVRALSRQVAQLQQSVDQLRRARARA